VALADGRIESDEWDFLRGIASALGATNAEIDNIKNHPDQVRFIPPKSHDERVQQIRDLVAIMTIDGHINEKELELCKKISLKLDILPRMVDDIVSEMAVDH
jgi:tellurite resistance protein